MSATEEKIAINKLLPTTIVAKNDLLSLRKKNADLNWDRLGSTTNDTLLAATNEVSAAENIAIKKSEIIRVIIAVIYYDMMRRFYLYSLSVP
jgi:hypothetical protein